MIIRSVDTDILWQASDFGRNIQLAVYKVEGNDEFHLIAKDVKFEEIAGTSEIVPLLKMDRVTFETFIKDAVERLDPSSDKESPFYRSRLSPFRVLKWIRKVRRHRSQRYFKKLYSLREGDE